MSEGSNPTVSLFSLGYFHSITFHVLVALSSCDLCFTIFSCVQLDLGEDDDSHVLGEAVDGVDVTVATPHLGTNGKSVQHSATASVASAGMGPAQCGLGGSGVNPTGGAAARMATDVAFSGGALAMADAKHGTECDDCDVDDIDADEDEDGGGGVGVGGSMCSPSEEWWNQLHDVNKALLMTANFSTLTHTVREMKTWLTHNADAEPLDVVDTLSVIPPPAVTQNGHQHGKGTSLMPPLGPTHTFACDITRPQF